MTTIVTPYFYTKTVNEFFIVGYCNKFGQMCNLVIVSPAKDGFIQLTRRTHNQLQSWADIERIRSFKVYDCWNVLCETYDDGGAFLQVTHLPKNHSFLLNRDRRKQKFEISMNFTNIAHKLDCVALLSDLSEIFP